MLSKNFSKSLVKKYGVVLILVLMEYALEGSCARRANAQEAAVLILVLMEYALEEKNSLTIYCEYPQS